MWMRRPPSQRRRGRDIAAMRMTGRGRMHS
jgi:hypothetical protein